MYYQQIPFNIFDTEEGKYYLACCAGADFALSSGYEKKFADIYNLKAKLNMAAAKDEWDGHGRCILVENIFVLINRQKSWQNTTEEIMQECIADMVSQIKENKVRFIAMPEIGTENGLEWNAVHNILMDETDRQKIESIDITVTNSKCG